MWNDRVMWIGWIEFDLVLGDVHSLKQKRAIVRPLVNDLRRTFAVAVAESASQDLYRRSGVGVAAVSADSHHVIEVLDKVEEYVARRPEVELLSTRRRVVRSDDDSAY